MQKSIIVGKNLSFIIAIAALLAASAPVVTSTANAAFCQKMFIPAYFYPGPLWDQATAAAATVGTMVMNPASGPGVSSNSDYVTAVNNAQAADIKVIGYVHTSYGSRDAAVVKAEIDSYKAWYGVSGIFLDEVASGAALIPYYQDLADYIRATAGTFVALNPGTIPDQGYMSVGDTVVVFEGTYNTYKNWSRPVWATQYPASKFVHLVHATVGTTKMKNAINWSHNRLAGNIYVTHDLLPNPWDLLPSYWSSELTQINKSCGF